jgi:hypothetical protein
LEVEGGSVVVVLVMLNDGKQHVERNKNNNRRCKDSCTKAIDLCVVLLNKFLNPIILIYLSIYNKINYYQIY